MGYMIDSKVVEAFQLMWGRFPDPAMLVRKNREIIAVNEACRKAGRGEGTNCASYGTPESHQGCLANQALANQQPAFRKKSRGEKEIIAYWLPLAGYPEVFVHFVIGAIVDYDAASETRA
jgi:hypothetical protein